MLRRAFIAGGLALGTANAFLAPAGTSDTFDDPNSVLDPKSRIVQIPCSSCAFAPDQQKAESSEIGDDYVWIQGVANNLHINLSVSDNSNRQQLEFNSLPIYPHDLYREAASHGRVPYVIQVPASSSDFEIASGKARSASLEVTGFGIGVGKQESMTPQGDAMTKVFFRITDVAYQPIERHEVTIDVLETSGGELLILKVDAASLPDQVMPPAEAIPRPHALPTENNAGNECGSLLAPICRLKHMFEAKFQGVRKHGFGHGRPCAGRKGGKHLPTHIRPFGPDGRPKAHHGRPHHVRPFGKHHGQEDHHSHHLLGTIARAAIAVIIPILAGITVGLTVSLLGLLMGRLVGAVWIRVARRDRRGYASVAQQETSAEEGKMLVGEEEYFEAPPMYEEAPAYQELAEATVHYAE